VDEQYFRKAGQQGMYPAMYYGHNLQFESAAAMFAGRYDEARTSARQTVELVEPLADTSPMLEPYALQPAWVALRFGRWDEALALSTPPSSRTVQTALTHFVRGAALAGQGKVAGAEQSRTALVAAVEAVPADLMISATNTGRAVLAVALADLDGRMAAARKDTSAAEAAFRRAIEAEDRLLYNEPPDWLLPARERLGALLLASGRAAQAEGVFRADLARNVGNPRSLFGLWKALEAQKHAGASEVQRAFEAAWAAADVTLGIDLFGAPH
jgi:tetratricopeptide (TPR) repeat protein